MADGLFSPMTVQHPLVLVGFAGLIAFLGAKDFKHALIEALAMLLLVLALANHWI